MIANAARSIARLPRCAIAWGAMPICAVGRAQSSPSSVRGRHRSVTGALAQPFAGHDLPLDDPDWVIAQATSIRLDSKPER